MSRIYHSDGAKLSYRDSGAGTPVVFLHPTPIDGEYWRPLTENLVGIRAIVPDLRGHGASELGSHLPVGAFAAVPDAPVLTVKQLAEDILKLLDETKIEKAVLAGCSIGGYVLLELWRQAPQRIAGLAFVCSKPHPDTEAGKAKRVGAIAQVRAGESAALLDGMAQNLVGSSARQHRPEIVAQLRSRMTLGPEALVAVQAGLAARPDSLPTVPTIDVPVLAIAGGEDPGVTPKDMEALQAAPGGCELHVLPDAGHFAAYEQPEQVASILAPWLRTIAES